MLDLPLMLYPWIKAVHLIAIVTWFAALFYLPRLFVYHAQASEAAVIDTFKTMERRLYKGIANPSVAIVFLAGIALLFIQPMLLKQGWMHIKLLLVFSLLAYHILCGRYMRIFAANKNTKGHVFYRWFNEYPTVVLVIVIALIFIRP